ncbi:hypothetical protein [Microbacterium sp. SA39]|uniref:hypothetical protein n=1 Tax=Microbacterium sp. SA39 TaxID=1263625 RepID=UPI00061EA37E|nr:hypothetical protein [Microbacterium sp. SA39]KJQ56121.1 hypothetical protein RS85_00025 [Microbacterium sp. SA39]
MTSWWRRQRVALIALAVAVAAVIGVHVWFDVLPGSDEPRVIEAQERSAVIAGQNLTVDSARWSEFEAPSGSRTLSIRVDSDGGPDATTCGLFTLAEAQGDRVWANARSALDVPYEAGESYCLEESGPYAILAVFLLPDDAGGPFLLDIPGDDEIARFVVEP